MDLRRTIFDNDRTLLYKWSQSKGIPIRLVVAKIRNSDEIKQPLEPDGISFRNLRDLISNLTINLSLTDTYFLATDGVVFPLKDQDIIMSWFEKQEGNLEEIVKEINAWYKLRYGKPRFTDVGDLEEYYGYWVNDLTRSFNLDKKQTESIIQTQESLEKYPPANVTDLIVKSSILNIDTEFKERKGKISIEDGTDIFNSAEVNSVIPFISYLETLTSERYLNKIYLPSHDRSVNFEQIYIPRGIFISPKFENTIYLNMYSSDETPDLSSVEASDFERVAYNLSNQKIVVESTPSHNQLYIDRISAALPTIKLGNINESRITAEFSIPNMDIFVPSFLDIILGEPLFNLYLYLDEFAQPQALKKGLTIRYRTSAYIGTEEVTTAEKSFGISIKSNTTVIDINMTLAGGKVVKIPKGGSYLTITINRAVNYSIIQEFMIIFRSLLTAYQAIRNNLDNIYTSFFPILTSGSSEILEDSGEEEEVKPRRKLERLLSEAPHIFKKIDIYGSQCQGNKKKPIIITPDKVNQWTSQKFNVKGSTYNRQVMAFPPRVPLEEQVLFGCDDKSYAFPGVIKNKQIGGVFTYIPCCFKTDQLDPMAKSKYNLYYNTSESISKIEVGKIKTVHKKLNILDPYRLGYIPIDLENILKTYKDQTWWNNRTINRMGVPLSPSSFLHSICEAVSDPGYIKLPIEEREGYIENLRGILASKISPHVLKQELWDLSDEEILNRIADPDVFFDPMLFYRCVEELYNVNVYVFSFVEEISSRIEIPRHKSFHARTLRKDRPVILIMKNHGTGRETIEIPQCELIIDIDIGKLTAFKVFGQNVFEIVHNLFAINNNVVTFSLDNPQTLVARSKLYSRVDLRSIFKSISQIWVDEYGKMRAVIFYHNGEPICVAGLPAQPENIPTLKSVNDIPLANIKNVLDVFGNPVAVTKDISTGSVTGVWYPILDVNFGVFIPIIPSDNEVTNNLPVGPPNPLRIPRGPSLEKIRILRKLAALLSQLAEYLFDIYRRRVIQNEGTIDPDFFNDKYTTALNEISDPLKYYNLNFVPKFLPDRNTVEEAISDLSNTYPTYLNNGKLILYNDVLQRRIAYYIRTYFKQTEGLNMIPRERINLFIDEEDFRQTKEMNVFVTEKDLDLWIKSQKLISTNLTILYKLDLNYTLILEPFIYQNPLGQIYFIQNVIDGNFKRALLVAKEWHDRKINIGPGNISDPEISNEISKIDHVVYGIGLDSQLTLVIDNSNGKKDYLELIYYGSNPLQDVGGRYGSLLLLL